MYLSEIIQFFEEFAPPAYQESYDNSGLLTGTPQMQVNGAIISLDITEIVIDEAINNQVNLIISHHPLVFNGLKTFTGKNHLEKCLIKAIKHDISIYTLHTNLDAAAGGVNWKICEKIGLINTKPLSPFENSLKKIVTFVPTTHAEKVRNALFEAGAGTIGKYESCSYNTNGYGTFCAKEGTNPYVGKINEIHQEEETRLETIYPRHKEQQIIKALHNAHPYEEVAFDIYNTDNKWQQTSIGLIGQTTEEFEEITFLQKIKDTFHTKTIRHTNLLGKKIKNVAVCGGSGSSLLKKAISQKADIFITADFKYHNFFDADNKILIADIGHYESEQFTKELIFNLLSKKFPTFAVRISETEQNPVHYF